MTEYAVKRTIVRVEYGTIEADSYHQAADMLRAGMWDDMVQGSHHGDREQVSYKINGHDLGDLHC